MADSIADLKSIFGKAAELHSAAEREAYLDQACGGDPRLRAEVESLLTAGQDVGGFFDGLKPPPAVAEGPGTVIGPYKLLQQIGEGGMGTVYMAEQTLPVQRRVALKIIKAGMDTKVVIARFEAERQALAVMDHPNIAKVFDAGTTDSGRPYFVMELVRGVPITKYCDEHRLTPRQRLELFLPVCQAIQHAHQKGIIHRDIKPSNILVAPYDGKPVVKVIDFGVAKATGQRLTDKTLFTEFGAVVGTLEYMSPEQAELNNQDIDTRSDIYSLGVLLYELLTGTTPMDRKQLKDAAFMEMLRVIREQEPSRPSTRLSTAEGLPTIAANRGTEPAKLTRLVRGELDWIVMKALEKDRGRRYETANGFAQDLQRYLADEPVQACPPSTAYRLRKLARRNKGPVVAAVLVLLAVAAGIVGTIWQALDATRERDAKQAALDRFQLLSAELAFDKGQLLGERGDADLALLWLARSQKLAPPHAAELQTAIRTSLGAWQRQVHSVRLVLPDDGRVRAVAFAPDGKLVTASWNEKANVLTVRLWDPRTGQPGDQLTFPSQGDAATLAFSPNANSLLLGFYDGTHGTVQLKNLATGKTEWEREATQGSHAVSAAFSPDGRLVLVGYCVGPEETVGSTGRAEMFEVARGRRLRALPHTRPVFAAAFYPDGKSFVTECGLWTNGTEKVKARFWNLEGAEIREPLEHPCMAQCVALSSNGAWLVTGNADGNARLWNLSAPQEPRILQHEAVVLSADFSTDGKSFLTGSADGTVRVWDLTGRLLSQPLRHGHQVLAAKFSPKGKTILAGVLGENRSRLWDLAIDGPVSTHAVNFFPLAFSPDRQTILTLEPEPAGGDETSVQLRDAATRQPVGNPLKHPRPVLLEGVSIHSGQRHACSSDRRRAVTLDVDNVARLWNTETGDLLADLKPLPELAAQPKFYAAAFSLDGRLVVTGNFHGTAHVWEAATGKLLGQLKHEMAGPVFNAAFSPDGQFLLTCGADNTARFWNAVTGEQLGEPLVHTSNVFAVAFSPDGKTVVTGGSDPIVQLWDVASRGRLLSLSGHQGFVTSVAFSPDGRFVLTGSVDQTARLWHATTGKPIGAPWRHPKPVARVAFGLDGKTILTTTDEPIARSWPLPVALDGPPEHLELWAQVVTGMELEADGSVRILDAAAWQDRRQKLESKTK